MNFHLNSTAGIAPPLEVKGTGKTIECKLGETIEFSIGITSVELKTAPDGAEAGIGLRTATPDTPGRYVFRVTDATYQQCDVAALVYEPACEDYILASMRIPGRNTPSIQKNPAGARLVLRSISNDPGGAFFDGTESSLHGASVSLAMYGA